MTYLINWLNELLGSSYAGWRGDCLRLEPAKLVRTPPGDTRRKWMFQLGSTSLETDSVKPSSANLLFGVSFVRLNGKRRGCEYSNALT